jgi:hypothetical protein
MIPICLRDMSDAEKLVVEVPMCEAEPTQNDNVMGEDLLPEGSNHLTVFWWVVDWDLVHAGHL